MESPRSPSRQCDPSPPSSGRNSLGESIFLPGDLDDPADDFDYLGRTRYEEKQQHNQNLGHHDMAKENATAEVHSARASTKTSVVIDRALMVDIRKKKAKLEIIYRQNTEDTANFLIQSAGALSCTATAVAQVIDAIRSAPVASNTDGRTLTEQFEHVRKLQESAERFASIL